jgi:hypothetical protein
LRSTFCPWTCNPQSLLELLEASALPAGTPHSLRRVAQCSKQSPASAPSVCRLRDTESLTHCKAAHFSSKITAQCRGTCTPPQCRRTSSRRACRTLRRACAPAPRRRPARGRRALVASRRPRWRASGSCMLFPQASSRRRLWLRWTCRASRTNASTSTR